MNSSPISPNYLLSHQKPTTFHHTYITYHITNIPTYLSIRITPPPPPPLPRHILKKFRLNFFSKSYFSISYSNFFSLIFSIEVEYRFFFFDINDLQNFNRSPQSRPFVFTRPVPPIYTSSRNPARPHSTCIPCTPPPAVPPAALLPCLLN